MNNSKMESYSAEDKAKMKQQYSKEQLAAIEAGEKNIDPKEFSNADIRDDPWSFKYIDDFSTIEPAVDHHVRAPITNNDPYSRLKTNEELTMDMANYIVNMPDEPDPSDWLRFTDNLRLTVGKEEAELNPHSSLVPEILDPGETMNKIGEHRDPVEAEMQKYKPKTELAPELEALMKATGYSEQEIAALRIKVLVRNSVTNQTRLGKIRKMYILSIAGNGNGLIGIGEAKSFEPLDAQLQSVYRAIRNMQPVLRYEGRTIYGDVKGKVGAVELSLMNRPPGTYYFSSLFSCPLHLVYNVN